MTKTEIAISIIELSSWSSATKSRKEKTLKAFTKRPKEWLLKAFELVNNGERVANANYICHLVTKTIE